MNTDKNQKTLKEPQMKKIIESVVLENKNGQRLRIYKIEKIYKVEKGNTFCIGLEGDHDHFEFEANEADDICSAIGKVVDGE